VRHRFVAAGLTAALTASVVTAARVQGTPTGNQTQSQPQPQARPPVFRAGANFVVVDAYPRKDGRFVEGLTKDDFQILEDGKPQAVEFFEFIRVPPYTSEADRRDPTSVEDADRQANDPRSRVFVLFLSSAGITVEGLREARTLGIRFLQRTLGPTDLFGIMTGEMTIDQLTLGRRLEVAESAMEQFWNERLLEAYGQSPTLEPRTTYEQFLYACYEAKGWEATSAVLSAARRDQLFSNLTAVTLKLGTIREQRSSILFFSGALPLGSSAGLTRYMWKQGTQPITDPMGRLRTMPQDKGVPRNANACDAELARMAANDYNEIFRALMDTARRANVVVHVVDPSGMSVFDPDPRRAGTPDPWRMANNRLEPLRTLAGNTGGEAILATNNTRELMARMADDLSAYYLLGYYSTNGKFDGKYRTIDVKVGQSGVKVSARKGYLAPTDAMVRAADTARDRAVAAVDAARADPPIYDRLLAELDADRRGDVAVRAVVQGDELVVVAEATGPAAGGRVPDGSRIAIRALAGATVIGSREETLASMLRSMLVRFPIPAGSDDGPWRVEVRVVTVEGPVTTRVTASRGSTVLGEPVLYRAAASPRATLLPAANREFRRTERFRLEWRVTTPLDERQGRVLGRNGSPLDLPVTVTEFDRDGQRVLAADLSLAPLGAGEYFLELTAASAGRTDRNLFAFQVR
jgi:VWFA-related protein